MKKILILLFLFLFNSTVFSVEKASYLFEIDNCEKRNKKMGDLAWKQCAAQIQHYNVFKTATGGASFIYQGQIGLLSLDSNNSKSDYDVNNIKYFRANIKNTSGNFVITQIEGLYIDIPGKEKIKVNSDFVKIFPANELQLGCYGNTPSNSLYDTHCIFIDLSKYNLKREDVESVKWTWGWDKILGVRMVENITKLFSSKIYQSDIDKCVRKHVGNKYNHILELFKDACIYQNAQTLDNKLIKLEKNLEYKENNNYDLSEPLIENFLQYEITNDISNDFMITKFSLQIDYEGKDCKVSDVVSKEIIIEPGSNFIENFKIGKEGFAIDKNVFCREAETMNVKMNARGIYY
ncbi:hypothetical protein OAM12_00785 [Candidatus Pelagibacter sp.]|nr:hypothetical protein [Candidatus Pelagibacter sp.]